MALLALLPAIDQELRLGLRTAALHVDYGLRGADSDRDRGIVEQACSAAEVPLHVVRLGGRLSGAGFQARAREQRYRRARELADTHGYDVLVTAHNRDDQAETIVYRLAKYASPNGLIGMRPRDGDVSRPLLCLGAGEIRDYCRLAGIEYGEDVTNTSSAYARNALRLEVLPRLRAINPRLAETLAAGAEQARAEADLLVALVADARARVVRPAASVFGPGTTGRRATAAEVGPATNDVPELAIDAAALAAEPAALRSLVVHELLGEAFGGNALVQRRLVWAVEQLASVPDGGGSGSVGGRLSTGCRVSLGRGLEAVRDGDLIRIRRRPPAHTCAPATVAGADLEAAGEAGVTVEFCGRRWRLRLLPGAVFERAAARTGVVFAGLSGRPRRVTLRHARRGERFAPLGLGAETTVARHLASARVPAAERALTPLVEIDGVIAWVGRHAPRRSAPPRSASSGSSPEQTALRAAPPPTGQTGRRPTSPIGGAGGLGRVARPFRVDESSIVTLQIIEEAL